MASVKCLVNNDKLKKTIITCPRERYELTLSNKTLSVHVYHEPTNQYFEKSVIDKDLIQNNLVIDTSIIYETLINSLQHPNANCYLKTEIYESKYIIHIVSKFFPSVQLEKCKIVLDMISKTELEIKKLDSKIDNSHQLLSEEIKKVGHDVLNVDLNYYNLVHEKFEEIKVFCHNNIQESKLNLNNEIDQKLEALKHAMIQFVDQKNSSVVEEFNTKISSVVKEFSASIPIWNLNSVIYTSKKHIDGWISTFPVYANNIDMLYLNHTKMNIHFGKVEIINCPVQVSGDIDMFQSFDDIFKKMKYLKNLKEIKLENLSIPNLDFLSNNTKLEKICIDQCYNLQSVKGLIGLPQLKVLEILSPNKVEDFLTLSTNPNFKNLQILVGNLEIPHTQ